MCCYESDTLENGNLREIVLAEYFRLNEFPRDDTTAVNNSETNIVFLLVDKTKVCKQTIPPYHVLWKNSVDKIVTPT